MAANNNSIREVELSSALHGAFIASPRFLAEFLKLIDVPSPEVVENVQSRVEYVTAEVNSTSRMDIYLWRDEPALKVGIEIKRAEEGIREEQIRDYLSLLKIIQQDGRLQKRRDAPKNAKLIVITGATETPEQITHIKAASAGAFESYIQWISWYRLVDVLDEVIAEENLRSLNHLSNLLSELGYISINSALPNLKTYQKVLTNLLDILNDTSIKSEMEVLEIILNRVEYEMWKLDYGVTIRLTKPKTGRKLVTKRRRRINLKSFDLFGGKIYTIGRAFQPNANIQLFQQRQKQPKSQQAGVGIAYSIPSRSWVAFIQPTREFPISQTFVRELSSKSRIIVDKKIEGFDGWILKGNQKRPQVVARFLKRVWESYENTYLTQSE